MKIDTAPSRADDAKFTPKPDLPPAPPGIPVGPEDADNFRVWHNKGRWYTDPLPGDKIAPALHHGQPTAPGGEVSEDGYACWPSISAVKKAAGKDWSFFATKRAARVYAESPHIFEQHAGDAAGVEARLNAVSKQEMGRAQTRGTHVHAYAEAALRGAPLAYREDMDNGAEYLPAVRAFFNDHRPTLVAAEVVCIHRDLHGYGYAGTADAIVSFTDSPTIPDGTYVIDWKSRAASGAHTIYAEEAAQISGYAKAQYMLVGGKPMAKRAPIPAITGGLIVSLKPDGYRTYPVDVDKGFEHFTAIHAWWAACRKERAAIGRVLPALSVATLPDLLAKATSKDEIRALRRINSDVWTAESTALAKARLADLG